MKLTVVMNMTGHHPHLISHAIYSVLNQSNKDFMFKIFCIHPDGLHLDKEYPNVEIHNIEPFEYYPLQIAYALKQVETPYWCVLDSDDYALPHHTDALIKGIEAISNLNIVPCHGIGCWGYWQVENKYVTQQTSGMWCRFAVTGFPQSRLQSLADGHKKQNGFDSILLRRINCQVLLDVKPSLVYRLGESWHVHKGQKYPKFEELPVITPEEDYDLLRLLHTTHAL
jgi:hypothetical protein